MCAYLGLGQRMPSLPRVIMECVGMVTRGGVGSVEEENVVTEEVGVMVGKESAVVEETGATVGEDGAPAGPGATAGEGCATVGTKMVQSLSSWRKGRNGGGRIVFVEGKDGFAEDDMMRCDDTPCSRVKASISFVIGRIIEKDVGSGTWIQFVGDRGCHVRVV